MRQHRQGGTEGQARNGKTFGGLSKLRIEQIWNLPSKSAAGVQDIYVAQRVLVVRGGRSVSGRWGSERREVCGFQRRLGGCGGSVRTRHKECWCIFAAQICGCVLKRRCRRGRVTGGVQREEYFAMQSEFEFLGEEDEDPVDGTPA